MRTRPALPDVPPCMTRLAILPAPILPAPILPALVLSALVLAAAAPATPEFRPDLFFAGRTHGDGTVAIATSSRPRILSVEGTGRIQPDRSLTLSQAVTLDGKTTQRSFAIRRVSATAWQGTLSDAAGPVRATVEGSRMTLAYPMKRAGMRMSQTLTLQPGGRTLLNRARVTLLGIQVARIEETITKLDD